MLTAFVAGILAASVVHAQVPDPLSWLSGQQKQAVFQLFAGYSEGFVCGKTVDFAIAGAHLANKADIKTLDSEKIAELAHAAIGIQNAQMQKLAQLKIGPEDMQKRCETVVKAAFGPTGQLIPDLLK